MVKTLGNGSSEKSLSLLKWPSQCGPTVSQKRCHSVSQLALFLWVNGYLDGSMKNRSSSTESREGAGRAMFLLTYCMPGIPRREITKVPAIRATLLPGSLMRIEEEREGEMYILARRQLLSSAGFLFIQFSFLPISSQLREGLGLNQNGLWAGKADLDMPHLER